jgi:hypothetical protein
MSDLKPCVICDSPFRVTWMDFHGYAQCTTCGAPYQILFYEGEGSSRSRIEKAPEFALKETAIPLLRDCWKETHAKLSAVDMRFSFPGGYDVASREDREIVGTWLERHRDKEAKHE